MSEAFIDYVMAGAKGVKMPRGDIKQIKLYPLGVPHPVEQQKIADCLGSLDDLIAAQGRTRDTLRQHKQGLMQQLFPQPGETVPKLRFPEFRDVTDWHRRLMNQYLSESRVKGRGGDEAKKLTVKLWGKGVIEKYENIQGSANTQYYRRQAGQFIYSKLDFLNQAFGIIPEYLDGFESTTDLPCFDISPTLNANFLLEYVKREEFYRTRGEIADGGRKAKRIHVETFLDSSIYVLSQAE